MTGRKSSRDALLFAVMEIADLLLDELTAVIETADFLLDEILQLLRLLTCYWMKSCSYVDC